MPQFFFKLLSSVEDFTKYCYFCTRSAISTDTLDILFPKPYGNCSVVMISYCVVESIGNIGLFTHSLSADYGGHGNSFHGSGGRGNKRAQMRYCLRLLRSMVSVGDEALNQDLVDQGAINQIVGECGLHDRSNSAHSVSSLYQECTSSIDILCLL